MRFAVKGLLLMMVCALVLPAAVQVFENGAVNSASYALAPLPNGKIAQGSIFSIFGSGLASSARASSFPLPAADGLGGATVTVTPSGGSVTYAILLFTSDGQINAVMPSAVPVGPATLTVTNGGSSSSIQIQVVKASVGIFTVNQGGTGPAALYNYNSASSQPQNAVNQAAHPGQVVILWGTGLGPILPAGFDERNQPQQIDMKDATGVKVYVGGIAASVQYAGRSLYAGEDQFNFQVPADAPPGCYVPIYVVVNGVVSNTANMAIASGTALNCTDDFNSAFTSSELANGLRLGSLGLTRVSFSLLGQLVSTDSASGVFEKFTPAATQAMNGQFGVSVYGACRVYTYRSGSSTSSATGTPLDAGPQLTLTLPDGSTKTLSQGTTADGKGSYSIPFDPQNPLGSPFLDQTGTYKITGPGGADVGPIITASLPVPTPLLWTNMTDITVVHLSADLPITWSGGAPDDAVLIMGMSGLDQNSGAGFICIAKNSDHQFTVPKEVLMALPVSADVSGTTSGVLEVGNFPTKNKATITMPNGLDVLSFVYEFFSAELVPYQP